MYLDLTDVLRGPGQTLEKPLHIAPTRIDDWEIVEPVAGVIRVENARQNVIVRGKARTAISLPCARCLQPSTQPLELEFEAVAPLRFFGPAGFGAGHHSHSHHAKSEDGDEDVLADPDDELAALFEGHSLDILELVRQAIELQAPIKPLCSPDCPGLPEAAQYFGGGGDARWGALQSWNKQHQNGNGANVDEADADDTPEPDEPRA